MGIKQYGNKSATSFSQKRKLASSLIDDGFDEAMVLKIATGYSRWSLWRLKKSQQELIHGNHHTKKQNSKFAHIRRCVRNLVMTKGKRISATAMRQKLIENGLTDSDLPTDRTLRRYFKEEIRSLRRARRMKVGNAE
jgi:hypothetical protein